MPFEKEFVQGEDFTPLRDRYGLDIYLESNTLQILNRDAYRMFVGKLIMFNDKYAKIAKNIPGNEELYKNNRLINTKFPIDIDYFYRINHMWRSIAKGYYASNEDPTGLKEIKAYRPEDQFPSTQIEMLKQSTKEVYLQLSRVVEEMKLGTPYTDRRGEEQLDYTKISYELLELTILATHAYTDAFNILEREYGPNALDKMQDLARSMHSTYYYNEGYHLPRRSLATDAESEDLISNPLSVKNLFAGYPEDEFLENTYYFEKKHAELEEQLKNISPEQKEANRKRSEEYQRQKKEEDRIAEEQRRAENQRLKEEQEAIRKAQEAKDRLESLHNNHEKAKQAFPIVPNDEKPSKTNQAMYAYFEKFAERMGIDPEKLNAQSIIQAASIAYLSEDSRKYLAKDNITDSTDSLLNSMVPIYNQIQRITYDAYIEKCLEENRPIDLSVPSNEVLDLMSVAMYTMYPTVVNGEQVDSFTLSAVGNVVNGKFSTNILAYDIAIREEALELAKAAYLEKDDSFFTADAEARFEAFTTQKKSSNNIISETAAIVNLYNEYKSDRADPAKKNDAHTALQEATIKKEAMDAAYALEKRIETRYNTRLSRFFRYFSYSNQKEELARVKGILGIPQDQRVAEHIKSSRINDLFVEANHQTSKTIRNERAKRVGNNPQKYINQLLENRLGKDNIPKITKEDLNQEHYQRIVRYSELTPAAIEAEKRRAEERQEELRREQEKREEEEILRNEKTNENSDAVIEEKVEVLSEEDIEAARIEEEIKARQQEEMKARAMERERRMQEEKEKLFNAEIERLNKRITDFETENKKLEEGRKNAVKACKIAEKELLNKLDELDEEKRNVQQNNKFLAEKLNALINQVGEQALGTMNSKDMEKFMNSATKEAQKNAGKAARDRKITNAEKVSSNIQDDQTVMGYMGAIESFRLELGKGEDRITAIANEKLELNKKIAAQGRLAEEKAGPGNVERENLKQIKQLREKIAEMQKNKESYLQDNKALGFNEAEFDSKLKEEFEIAKGLSDESDIRVPFKIEMGENENIVPKAQKVEQIESLQKEIQK